MFYLVMLYFCLQFSVSYAWTFCLFLFFVESLDILLGLNVYVGVC